MVAATASVPVLALCFLFRFLCILLPFFLLCFFFCLLSLGFRLRSVPVLPWARLSLTPRRSSPTSAGGLVSPAEPGPSKKMNHDERIGVPVDFVQVCRGRPFNHATAEPSKKRGNLTTRACKMKAHRCCRYYPPPGTAQLNREYVSLHYRSEGLQ